MEQQQLDQLSNIRLVNLSIFIQNHTKLLMTTIFYSVMMIIGLWVTVNYVARKMANGVMMRQFVNVSYYTKFDENLC